MRYFKSLFARTYQEWNNHDATTYGAALSYYTVLSLAPLLVIAVAMAGVVFRKETVQNGIIEQVTALMGNAGAEAFLGILTSAQSPKTGVIASLIGIVVLLVSASGVFRALRTALNRIWDVKLPEGSGWWGTAKEELFSFAMVLAIGFLLLLSLAASTLLAAFGKLTANHMSATLVQTLGNLICVFCAGALFAVIFRFVPEQTLPWRKLWPGALATGVLMTLGKYLLGLYLVHASVGSAYGAAGSLVVLLAWVYYSALLFLFGAEFTRVYACQEEGDCLNMNERTESDYSQTPLRKAG